MKKYLFAAFLFGSAFLGYGQMILSSGSQIIVNSGSVVVANDINGEGGTITNHGEVSVLGDITNNSGVLFNSSSTDGTVTFEGSSAQEITGTSGVTFYGTVDIDNTSGVALTATATGAPQTIDGTLNFTNGLLTLNAFNLTIGTTDPTNISSAKYIKTNGAGSLKRTVAASDVLFPVGISAYNPVILNNAGTSDTYNVRVVDAEPAGASTAHMVDRSWVVTDDIADGSNLTVTPQWNSATEELTNFDRTNSSVGLTTNNGTDYTWTETGAATGADPYSKSGASFTTLGTFAVGDYYYSGKRLDLKFFLAGAYNGTTMDQDLYTASLVPPTDPYGIEPTVSTTIPATAVDWVKVVLRDATTPTVLIDSFAFFVDVNGNLLDRDGNAGGLITGVNLTSYNIAVMHRNHFGVMTSAAVDLDVASPSWDFTTVMTQAWEKSGVTNDAMKNVGGVFCLWDGNAKSDDIIRYNGVDNDRQEILSNLNNAGHTLSGYETTDVNMDGITRYNGVDNDRQIILGILNHAGYTVTQHLP